MSKQTKKIKEQDKMPPQMRRVLDRIYVSINKLQQKSQQNQTGGQL